MKKKQIILSVVLLAVGILIGAAGGFMFAISTLADTWGFMQRVHLVELEELALDAYSSSDADHAERALLRVATNIQDLIEMDLATDIPGKSDLHFDLVLTYGRLGALLEAQDKQKRASAYYALAIQKWDSVTVDFSGGKRPMSIEKLKSVVASMDPSEKDSQQPAAQLQPEGAPSD